MEKKIVQLQETIVRMQEEQHQLAQANQLLMSIMIQMFSQQMGITVPKEQLLAAGLSADVNRNAMKTKKDSTAKVQGIPPTNELIASMMSIFGAPKPVIPKSQPRNLQTSGQPSKSVNKNE